MPDYLFPNLEIKKQKQFNNITFTIKPVLPQYNIFGE